MSGAERMRRHRQKQRARPTLKSARAELEADRPILRGFQQYLDEVWPGWERFEGGTMYPILWQAYAAGWRAHQTGGSEWTGAPK